MMYNPLPDFQDLLKSHHYKLIGIPPWGVVYNRDTLKNVDAFQLKNVR